MTDPTERTTTQEDLTQTYATDPASHEPTRRAAVIRRR